MVIKYEKEEYPLTIDIQGFEEYEFEKQFELYNPDLEFCSSYEVEAKAPRVNSKASFEKGKLTTYVKPLSWNVVCFQKKN